MQRRLIGSVISAMALAACADKAAGDPVYADAQCRRLSLIDAATQAEIVGAEDLAFDPETKTLYISAYDRRAVERAARKSSEAVPQGGLYAVALDVLAAADQPLTLSSLVATAEGGVRPHGVSFDQAGRSVHFINRAYDKAAGDWRMTPQIVRVGEDGGVERVIGAKPRCSANDLASSDGAWFISFDHASCGWRAGLEDVGGGRNTGVDAATGESVYTSAAHANGIVAIDDGRLALAATRDKAIIILGREGEQLSEHRRIDVPGAPDNLTMAANGAIVAALHPSLLSIGLSRRLGFGKGGSRIVRVDPETGAVVLLFEDPKATLFSAASAAVEADGVLVMGSALDKGLLVCRGPAP